MKKVLLLAAVFVVGSIGMARAESQADAEFLGVAKCKMCHMKQFKTWENSKHAKTFEALQGDEVKNPDCLKCRTTGLKADGTFVDKGTSCEACHGAGSLHMKAKKEDKKSLITRKPISCANCHNPHISRKMMAEEMRKK